VHTYVPFSTVTHASVNLACVFAPITWRLSNISKTGQRMEHRIPPTHTAVQLWAFKLSISSPPKFIELVEMPHHFLGAWPTDLLAGVYGDLRSRHELHWWHLRRCGSVTRRRIHYYRNRSACLGNGRPNSNQVCLLRNAELALRR
jgi:hypothetical protein